MSSYLSIATVTAVLTDLLSEALDVVEGNARVTHLRPDQINDGDVNCRKGINVYLYQVTHNAALRNEDLPMRDTSGRMVLRPAVALNLHYLISFYGEDVALEPQKLLAKAAALLRARAVLDPAQIRSSIKHLRERRDVRYDFLSDTDLADAPEWVRFSPEDHSLEALSRMWSVFYQTKYLLSLGYQAHAVVVDSELAAGRVVAPDQGIDLDLSVTQAGRAPR